MRKKLVSIVFIKKTIYLVLFMILILVMQTMMAFSLSTSEFTLKSSGSISYGQSSSPAGPLHVEGNQIKNDFGEIVYLRGVNRVWFTVSAGGGFELGGASYSQVAVEKILTNMENYGFNTLRCFSAAEFWINNPSVTTDSGRLTFRKVLDDFLTRCENHGIYLIWSTYSVLKDTEPTDNMAYPPYTRGSTLIPNAAAFVDYVVQQVTVLGSHNNLIIEPYNEPWSNWSWQSWGILNEWQSVWQNIITGIRATEDSNGYSHHLILAGYTAGLGYWGDLSEPWMNLNWITRAPLTDSAGNIVYTIHAYRAWGSVGTQEPILSRPYAYNNIKSIYQAEGLQTASQSYPILIGEIGAYQAYDSNNGEYLWLKNTLQILNEWGIGYTGFYWGGATYSLVLINEDVPQEIVTGGTVNKYGQLFVDS